MPRGEPSRTAFGAATRGRCTRTSRGGRSSATRWHGRARRRPRAGAGRGPGGSRPPRLRLFIAARHRSPRSRSRPRWRAARRRPWCSAPGWTPRLPHPHPTLRSGRSTTPTPAPGSGTGWPRRHRPATSATSAWTSSATTCVGRLVKAGLDTERPTFFLWLGVVPYLSTEAFAATLCALGGMVGAEVVLDYPRGPPGSTTSPAPPRAAGRAHRRGGRADADHARARRAVRRCCATPASTRSRTSAATRS